jgi:hypothetical protein
MKSPDPQPPDMPPRGRVGKFLRVLPSLVLVTLFVLFARWFIFFGGTKAAPTFSLVGSTIRPAGQSPPDGR